MIPNPIRKVLSTFQNFEVRALLMGGQACVFYGGAEFSRDTDFAILAEPENLDRLRRAMTKLCAEVIAVPPFEEDFLLRGHAIHFRCHHPEAAGMRVDVMAKMRGVSPFSELWERRTTLGSDDGARYELLSLPDLVAAKKTQRDKDWPMIRRLLEADYAVNSEAPCLEQVHFWLQESRTPDLLMELAKRFPAECAEMVKRRPLLKYASVGEAELEEALASEERVERAADRAYWKPLREELESLRRERLR